MGESGFVENLRTVQIATLGRARYRDFALGRRQTRAARPTRWNRDGLDMIAAGVRRDVVAVF